MDEAAVKRTPQSPPAPIYTCLCRRKVSGAEIKNSPIELVQAPALGCERLPNYAVPGAWRWADDIRGYL
jgi:hypothetical protein